MNSLAKRYVQYFGAPVLSVLFIMLSFSCLESAGFFIAVLGVVFLFFKIRKEQNQTFHLVDFFVLCLFLIDFFEGLSTGQCIYGKTYLLGLFFNVLVYFTIRFSLRKERQEDLFMGVMAGFVILLSLLTICSFYFFKFNIEYEGFTDLVNFKSLFHPLGSLLNDLVTILLLSSAFLLLALTRARFVTLWFWILVTGIGLVQLSIVFSFSRGAYLSVLVGLAVFFGLGLLLRVVSRKKILLFITGTLLMLILAALPVKQEFITTAGLTGSTSQLRSVSGRVELWKAAYQLIKEEPLSGVGNDQFSLRANPYLASNEDAMFTGRATNSYLQLLVEKGIIGFVPWAVFIGLLMSILFRQIRRQDHNSLPALLLLSVFITVLFRELSFSTFFEKEQLQLLFFVLAAWIVNRDKNNQFSYKLTRLGFPVILTVLFFIVAGFQMLYEISAKNSDTYIERYQDRDFSGALNAITCALKFDPKNPQLVANKGYLLNMILAKDSFNKSENKENALAYYCSAVRYSPCDPYLQHNLAWLYFNNGKADSAEVHYRKACELSANTALFHISKGLLQERKKTGDYGVAEYKKAIRLSPELLDSEFGRELTINFSDDFRKMLNEVIDSLSLKIKKDESPILKGRLAKMILYRGDTALAIQLFEKASKELPNLDRPWYYMAKIKLAQNDTVTFLKYMNRAILLDPRDYCYPLALGDYYFGRNQKRDAIYYYKNAVFNHANNYTQHAMISPKWYGYKSLPEDVLPVGLLERISPSFDKTNVCSRLSNLLQSTGQNEEAKLFETYKNGEITVSKLFKELKSLVSISH